MIQGKYGWDLNPYEELLLRIFAGYGILLQYICEDEKV